MCGRYSLIKPVRDIARRFGVEQLPLEDLTPGDGSSATVSREHGRPVRADLAPRYNIAPSQDVLVVVIENGARHLRLYKWGLVPFWAKDLKKTKPVINARSETLAQKPYFKHALARKRCLIPADGFFEWKQVGGKKIPVYIHLRGKAPFAFAGLFDEHRDHEGSVLRTCTIITVPANETLQPIHERMPSILQPSQEPIWLDPSAGQKDVLSVLQPYPDEEMESYVVSPLVNSPAHDAAECVLPI